MIQNVLIRRKKKEKKLAKSTTSKNDNLFPWLLSNAANKYRKICVLYILLDIF